MIKATDKKYWGPNQQVVDWITNEITPEMKVLEVGPGHAPFKRADAFVDFVDIPGVDMVKVDMNVEKLPFPDKSFDFIYCRHTIEDMWNPFNLLGEMNRVGKSGYVETPSVMAELSRGVDGGTPPFRGYHHHRFMAWTFGKELRLISKYPFVEYLRFDEQILDAALAVPRYWNNYHLWQGELTFAHRQSPIDFDIPKEYGLVLNEAIERSKESIDIFWHNINGGKQ